MTTLIKKYKNRRLYDMEKSQYITLDDLQQYVLQGHDFRVEDSTTGEDLTNTILLQILVEIQSASSRFLSAELLKQLIKLAHHPLNQTAEQLLQETMGLMQKQFQANPWAEYQKANEEWTKKSQQLFAKWQELFKKPD